MVLKKRKAPKARVKRVLTFDDRLRYPIPEAATFMRISRAKLYQNISAGLISTVKDGKRIFVPGSEILRVSRPQPAAA